MISIAISCEESEISALHAMLSGWILGGMKEKIEPARVLEEKKPQKPEKVPYTDTQKQEILSRHAGGQSAKDIAVVMGSHGQRVQGIIMGEKRRKVPKNVAPVHAPVEASERATAEGELPEVQTPAEESDPTRAVKSYTPAVLNGLIWDLHRAGKTPGEISDELYAQGYCFDEGFVFARIKKIEGGNI